MFNSKGGFLLKRIKMKSKSTWWGTRSTVLGSGSPTSYHLSCWVVAEIAEISASDYKFKLPGCVVYLRGVR